MSDHPTNTAVPPPPAGGPRRAAAVISLICAVQFVLQLDFRIVNVALPSVQRELDMAPAELQWILTGYALAFGSLPRSSWRSCAGCPPTSGSASRSRRSRR